jgi:Mn-containing catalase
MILRLDRIMTALPIPETPDANGAAAVQELMGGKFGEMSTLMNYTMQSFNMRGRSQIRPFYDLVANIAAEEFAHIELVSYTINIMLSGATERGNDPAETPLKDAADWRYAYHAIATGQQAYCGDSHGKPWSGDNVFSSGNLKLDLLHNFFLECGARANKIRVYEMTSHPTARAMVGFLLVRGGVHIVAYAKAIEKLSGVPIGKLLPVPDVSNKRFPESAKHEARGEHRVLYRFSPEDYKRVGEIWNGEHPEDGQELTVQDGPPEGAVPPELPAEPQLTAPMGPDAEQVDPEIITHYAKKIFGGEVAEQSKRRAKGT